MKITRHVVLASALAAFLVTRDVYARDLHQEATPSPISTDRPGFLFSPALMPEGRAQFELGLPTWVAARGGGTEASVWTVPAAVRFGLSRDVELRASLPTWTIQRVESGGADEHDRGFADAELGVKLALGESTASPWALQMSVRLPTGETPFTTEEFGETAYLLHGTPLGNDWSGLFLAGVLHTPVDDASDLTQGALGALASHPLAPGWNAYGEVTLLPGLRNQRGQAYAGTGVAWTVTDDVQFDLSADFGLDDDSSDVIAAFGVSFRL